MTNNLVTITCIHVYIQNTCCSILSFLFSILQIIVCSFSFFFCHYIIFCLYTFGIFCLYTFGIFCLYTFGILCLYTFGIFCLYTFGIFCLYTFGIFCLYTFGIFCLYTFCNLKRFLVVALQRRKDFRRSTKPYREYRSLSFN